VGVKCNPAELLLPAMPSN